MTVTVALADDQSLIRAGLRTILESEPDLEVVGEASDGREAVALVRDLSPDVLLLDVQMPVMDGLEALRLISAAGAGTRVVMLTTFDLDGYVYEALKAGAAGFLVKDIRDDQLVAGVRAAATGETLLAPTVTRRLIESYTRRPPGGAMPTGVNRLTPRETEVWRLLAHGRSNHEIAGDLFVSETTVKTHVAKVLAKLEVRDRVQAVVAAYEAGVV